MFRSKSKFFIEVCLNSQKTADSSVNLEWNEKSNLEKNSIDLSSLFKGRFTKIFEAIIQNNLID